MLNLFHGTTLKGAEDIIKNGYDYFKGMQAWGCSNPKHMYFYNPIKMIEVEMGLDLENCDLDDWADAENRCVELAKGAGDIQNALQKKPDNQVCVLEFIFNEEVELEALNWLAEDYSCEYMDLANTLPVDFVNECIKNQKVGIIIHYFNFYVKLSPFYLISLINNPYFTLSLERLPKEEYDALMLLKETDYADIFDTILAETQETVNKIYWNFTTKRR